MVIVLEAVLAVDAVDDALAYHAAAGGRATQVAAWNDAAWRDLPPGSVILIGDRRLALRARAARAQNQLAPGLAVVDLDPRSASWLNELGMDPVLVPLWRDLALAAAPTEASLSSLAARRPLFVAVAPKWDAPTARHLVPFSLLDRFEPEPHGSADRRRALDAFAPSCAALAASTAGDPDLLDASARLLASRAAILATAGDRALAERATADAARF
jgi:hypothetical protein